MIRAEHIVKSFDGRVVLDDISVEFETGKTNARIRISMRMHTYTRAYVIYKVARDRVITWGEDTVFCIFCIYVS